MSVNDKELKRLLQLFIEATGPAGFEDPIRKLVQKEVESHADESYTDPLGNFIFKKKGASPDIPALLIMAHMDEIGMLVRYIDPTGFIQFSYLGGFFDQITLGQRIQIHGSKGPVIGVIGSKPPHLMDLEERKKVVTRRDMFIDVGATSAEEIKALGIEIGDPITWLGPFQELTSDTFCGKSLDNRVLVAMMIEAFKTAKPNAPLICVASVREEVGLQGARTSTFALDLDHQLGLGISLDIALAGDFPLVKKGESPIHIGKGPTITIAHGRRNSLQDGYIIHPEVKKFLIKLAEKHTIPYQLEIMEGGLTDGTEIALTRRGIPTANIGIPTRYVHSPAAIASLTDIKNGIRFLTLIAQNLPKAFKRP
ncbi:MAG: M42 family metallopeptidase [Candidatus Helarchaeota archaeon]|nr:M42 family metallopeptidase [Candidatus Helarchaeota archaeon]